MKILPLSIFTTTLLALLSIIGPARAENADMENARMYHASVMDTSMTAIDITNAQVLGSGISIGGGAPQDFEF